ncbi:hypothetical protein NLX82_16250 [Paenibacillus sp. A3M_27_13]|nr:hypothetical protein [Paenibacillus sp. A3M_27_13]
MIDVFVFNLPLELYGGVLAECLGILIGFRKYIGRFGEAEVHSFSIALILRTLIVMLNSRLIHSATSGSVRFKAHTDRLLLVLLELRLLSGGVIHFQPSKTMLLVVLPIDADGLANAASQIATNE